MHPSAKPLFARLNKANIFWNLDIAKRTVPDSLFIEYTLLYADIPGIIELVNIFGLKKTREVWEKQIAPDKRYLKLNYYLAVVFSIYRMQINFYSKK